MQEDSPSLAAGWELGQCSCPKSELPLGIPCRDPQTPAGSLPTGTRRLLIHPHHPFHSKGRIRVKGGSKVEAPSSSSGQIARQDFTQTVHGLTTALPLALQWSWEPRNSMSGRALAS